MAIDRVYVRAQGGVEAALTAIGVAVPPADSLP